MFLLEGDSKTEKKKERKKGGKLLSRTDLDLSNRRHFERWEPSCRQQIGGGFTCGGPRVRSAGRKIPNKHLKRGKK
ncbi:MAG TPA: hypothetical protein VMV66_01710 [Candidatus Humimicrobiaceae bacterium]|nr:hypothetical protein [Candidatus Humimicrobiaceae bacterium]